MSFMSNLNRIDSNKFRYKIQCTAVNPGKLLPQLDGEVSTYCWLLGPAGIPCVEHWSDVWPRQVFWGRQGPSCVTSTSNFSASPRRMGVEFWVVKSSTFWIVERWTVGSINTLPSISPAGWSPSGPDEKGRIAPHEPKRQPLIEVSGGWLVQSSCL